MSRYAVAADDRELAVWVGWDEGLGTFFAQVVPPGGVDDDGLLLWVGTTPGEIVDEGHLAAAVSAWTTLDAGVLADLADDRAGRCSRPGRSSARGRPRR